MIKDEDIEMDLESNRFCAICGDILQAPYIASSFDVTAHNWMMKEIEYFGCGVCYHCYKKIMENVNGGIALAYEKIGREYVYKED